MKKNQVIIISAVLLMGLFFSIHQYIETFKTQIVAAVQTTPNPGHSWTEMECTESFCVDTANKRVGIGTDTPSSKFNVVGNVDVTGTITATVDVCNSSGACLSQLDSFIGAQNLLYSSHTFNMCTTTGGEVVNVGTTQNPVWICKFNSSSCPSGQSGQPNWTQYLNYTTTSTTVHSPRICYPYYPDNWPGRCTTGSHAFSNTQRESCVYSVYSCNCGCAWGPNDCCADCCYVSSTPTGYANIIQIGCY